MNPQTLADHNAIRDGFVSHFKRAPSEPEALILHAVAQYETGFGRYWSSLEGREANNLGAIQYRTPSQLGLKQPYPAISPDGNGFLYTDTRPNNDGTSTRYSVYFRRYPTLAAGAAALARTVYDINGRKLVLEAAKRGDVLGVSQALYTTRLASELRGAFDVETLDAAGNVIGLRTGDIAILSRYYEGWGASTEDRIRHHYEAMTGALLKICRALEKPLPDGTPLPPPTLKRGDSGEPVAELQRRLNAQGIVPELVADGMFGKGTELAVTRFQEARGLKADGVVGPATWAALEEPAEPVERPTLPDIEPKPEPTMRQIMDRLDAMAHIQAQMFETLQVLVAANQPRAFEDRVKRSLTPVALRAVTLPTHNED